MHRPSPTQRRTHQQISCGELAVSLTFGTLATFFCLWPGLAACYAVWVLLLDLPDRSSPLFGPLAAVAIVPNLAMLAAALVCTCTSVRALDGRPVILWGCVSAVVAAVALVIVLNLNPHYFFLGM